MIEYVILLFALALVWTSVELLLLHRRVRELEADRKVKDEAIAQLFVNDATIKVALLHLHGHVQRPERTYLS